MGSNLPRHRQSQNLCFLKFILLFIYLFNLFLPASGLRCRMGDLLLRHAGSFVVARRLLVVACGFYLL